MTDEQYSLCIAFPMMPVKLCKIDVGKDVGIVHQERFVAVQKRTPLLYPDRLVVEQHIPFVTEVDSDAEIVIGAEKLDNLFSKVVDIDRNVIESGFFQP